MGTQALYYLEYGSGNTASGTNALYYNTTGFGNTASGMDSLFSNSTGNNNTAFGTSLYSNTTGSENTASGSEALNSNSIGNYNAAFGANALRSNTSGAQNAAFGLNALQQNSSGSYNIAVGHGAGFYITGSNNIDIGAVGVAADSGVIRIGTHPTQTATYIAGIYGTSVSGSAVVVSSTGQLGVTVSSERFKTAIAPMGSDTARLGQLRPVSFRLKSDTTGTRQYGLIAEEVAKVYPELVIRDQTGKIDGVRYDELAPMLLNEVQQQQRKMATQEETTASQGAELRTVQQQLAELTILNQATQVALRKLQATDEFVAQR
jgi:hypothetical protein